MSNKKTYDERIQAIKAGLMEAAKETNEHPSLVDKRHFKKHAKDVSEWDLREVGGFVAIKKELFPLSEEELAGLTKNKLVTSYVNKVQNNIGSEALFKKTLLESCTKAMKSLVIKKVKVPKKKKTAKGTNMTIGSMLSDLHFGKKTKKVDLKVLRERMVELKDVFLNQIEVQGKIGFNVERLIINLMGDMIESFTMHGMESAMSSEFGNAQQVESAITSIYHDFLLPIAMTGVSIHCPCVSGNHDRVDRNKTFNDPGTTYMTWIIYNMLQQLCAAQGLKNITFDIPTESFTTVDIYGSTVLIEHGDKLKNTSKQVIENHILRRQKQVGRTIHMARFGHWHEYVCYDRGRAIVNESLPGPDSYSVENGYTSTPGQVLNFYVDTKDRPNSFYYSFPVYLG